jgi:hypothetical protein
LDKIFKILEEYKVRLNPKKYVFGVTLINILDYIISRCGIEVDLAKVKVILYMFPPKKKGGLWTL